MHPRRSILLAALCYTVLGAAIYAHVIANGGFVMDDHDYIVANPMAQNMQELFQNMTELRWVGYLTFVANYSMFGADPMSFHATNVVIHIATALAAFLMTRALLVAAGISADEKGQFMQTLPFWVGALFLVHPIQTQAVSYVSQRFTSLATFFYLVAALTYVEFRLRLERTAPGGKPWWLYGASLVAAVLAVKTKETAFTLPVALVLVELIFFRVSRLGAQRFVFAFPYVAVATIIPLSLFAGELGLASPSEGLLAAMRAAKQQDLRSLSPYLYFINQVRIVVGVYLRLLLFPVGQRPQYDYGAVASPLEAGVLLSAGVLVAMAVFAAYCYLRSCRDRAPLGGLYALASFGIGWFFVTASVESSFLPIKHLVFEHRMYLPSFGFFLAVASLGTLLCRHAAAPLRRVALRTVPCLLILILGATAYARNEVWSDGVRMWTDVVEKSPLMLAGWHNLAVEYRNRKQSAQAMACFDRAVSLFHESFQRRVAWPDPDLNPENAIKVFGARAKLALELGDFAKARQDVRQISALARITPNRPFALTALSDVAEQLVDRSLYDEAIGLYSRLLEIAPGMAPTLVGRGRAHLFAGNNRAAEEDLSGALGRGPADAEALFLRATARERLGDAQRARMDLERACSLGYGPACSRLGRTHPGPSGREGERTRRG